MEFKLFQSPDMFIYVFESKRFIDCFYRKNSWEIQICNSFKSSGSRFPENDIEEGYPPPPSYQIFISRNVLFKIAGSRTSIPLHVCITDSTSMLFLIYPYLGLVLLNTHNTTCLLRQPASLNTIRVLKTE